MATVTITLICAAAEVFLICALVQFTSEIRKERRARAAAAVFRISRTGREKPFEERQTRDVVEIQRPCRQPSQERGRRAAF